MKLIDVFYKQFSLEKYKRRLGNFLFLTDIHIDDKYTEGGSVGSFCRVIENRENGAGYYGQAGCDMPRYTLPIVLDKFKEKIPDTDFIILGGDNGPHDFSLTRSPFLENSEYVVNMVRKRYPNSWIVPVLGNHDFPESDIQEGNCEILQKYHSQWRGWIPKTSKNTFRKFGGYYAHRGDIHLIVLNTNYFSKTNIEGCINSKGKCQTQLRWLDGILKRFSGRQEKVYIIGHHPPRRAFFIEKAFFQIVNILNKYENTISAFLSGHMHEDLFYIVDKEEVSEIEEFNSCKCVVLTIPSITPNQTSRGRLFYYNESGLIMDYKQYSVEFGENTITAPITINEEYGFQKEYGEDYKIEKDSLCRLAYLIKKDSYLKETYNKKKKL
eukprot:GHVP01060753.1.p1 GENE.GHVP01060753.1~~GHVP01060753.1.p1  ORF type:complete len:382 (+),score=58.60 GHVP01060753.1:1410-2555(+)